MSKIGILGGTFDPIHIGHLLLAECARESFDLEKVWFIPTGHSYEKDCESRLGRVPSPEERLEMARLAVRDHPLFECLDLEVRRPGATYSFETLEELRDLYPRETFYFILGSDCLLRMDAWREPGRIFDACQVLAAARGDADEADIKGYISRLERKYGAEISILPFRDLDISSSEIRERVRQGLSIRYMTPDSVAAYIDARGFYRT
ncbi:MAG: nicotinate-nucleotide adenylyltransferase [Clostridium sp.]|nr:nicotinate-nucleotide adenylyltransferase [Acetatifactor muris]MCM1526525.1 nicotinate-nucleotide adenylyltransferase [Bacteroides sp.]MCM1562349.1 nicotinate-nucleotide adenylyltransferase [Clostridium sp.]